MNKAVSRQKIDSFCMQFGMSQIIRDSTHYTENFQSLIGIFLVTSPDDVIDSGVGETFLDQNVRFHCPIYCILRFNRTTAFTFRRKVWTFSQVDYVTLRNRFSTFDWHSCFDKYIDIYAANCTREFMFLYAPYISLVSLARSWKESYTNICLTSLERPISLLHFNQVSFPRTQL